MTPTPFHDEKPISELAKALASAWQAIGLPLFADDAEEAPRQARATGNTRSR